jgi:hypothetical protein
MLHQMTTREPAKKPNGADMPIAQTLCRLAALCPDIPAASLATLGVLWEAEDGPRSFNGLFTALRPLFPILASADTWINVPLLHTLVENGWLETQYIPSPASRGERMYGLTTEGATKLAELRRVLQEAGRRGLVMASAALDRLGEGRLATTARM